MFNCQGQPSGPLNNRGKHISSRKKKCKTKTSPRAQNTHTTRSRPWWPLWPSRATSLRAPRERSASLEGRVPPRARAASLEGPHAHAAPAPARTSEPFNALTPAGLRHDPHAPRNHASALFHRLPGQDHPCHCTTLCGEAGVSSVALCRPLLYG
jgi:hypothetical protein